MSSSPSRRYATTNQCIVYFCCPETKGLTLEEIDLVFLKKGSELASGAVKTLKHEDKDHPSSLAALEDGDHAKETGDVDIQEKSSDGKSSSEKTATTP